MKNNILFLEKYKEQLFEFCDQYQIEKMYAFGSVVAGNFHAESDVDL